MATQPSNNFDFQNYYSATLQADITSGSLSLTLDNVPTPTEGILVIEPDSSSNREIIFYTGKTASTVTLPSDGRGWDSTTATAHLTGSTVIMAPVAYMLRMLKSGSLFDNTITGWTTLGTTPTYSATNGNRSFTLATTVDKSTVLSPGMRLKFDRVTAAPTQCTSLNGSTQYYSKTAPAGMTFTDDFTCSAYVKLSSYPSTDAPIISRIDGTQGWWFGINSSGQVILSGHNAALGNYSRVVSYQSIPLNKWVHIQANLDMSAFTTNTDGGASGSTIALDGTNVPSSVVRGGTNPTALVQAGNLNIGTGNAGTGFTFFPGKIAQAAVWSLKITIATMQGYISQGLAGTETSLISAYSFNNSINDLNTTNANNLTANGSAVATNADSPFAQGATAGVTEYGIITKVTSSTITLQCPEGSCVPATGTMTNFYYSATRVPYNFPAQQDKWDVLLLLLTPVSSSGTTVGTVYNPGGLNLNIPIGAWTLDADVGHSATSTTTTTNYYAGVSTSASSFSDPEMISRLFTNGYSAASLTIGTFSFRKGLLLTTATPYYPVISAQAAVSGLQIRGDMTSATNAVEHTKLAARCAYL